MIGQRVREGFGHPGREILVLATEATHALASVEEVAGTWAGRSVWLRLGSKPSRSRKGGWPYSFAVHHTPGRHPDGDLTFSQETQETPNLIAFAA